MKSIRVWTFALSATLAGSTATAQSFGNQWVSFTNDTATRLAVAPTSVSKIDTEVDFAHGDLDQDGFTDLVVVRKQPAETAGKRTNVLLMNVAGVLTDKTAQFASAADVAGDQGFLTPTNDRDVVVVDVDGDGWQDVVTAVVISFGDPKHLSHPRVYRNLGDDVNGNWLGLRFENGRIPQLFAGAVAAAGNACGIAAGDIDGDQDEDLFLVDYDSGEPANQDTGHRLLINDGNGFFSDQSATRLTANMIASAFGTAGSIADMNGDGWKDIVRSQNGPADVYYNNPNNVGSFNLLQNAYTGSAYFVGTGDLNKDGRIDIAIGDDVSDVVRYNTGVDALGRVIWSTQVPYKFLSGGDDGFANQMVIDDLDGDGWNEVVQTDFDVQGGGCDRYTHIYHNPGGTVGSNIQLIHERENATPNAWLGAPGLKYLDLNGTFNAAVFDVDNDGDKDMVLGRCSGTFVWTNDGNSNVCQPSLGFGGPGDATLECCGDALESGGQSSLSLSRVAPNASATLLASTSSSPTFVPELNGTLITLPILLVLNVPTNALGEFTLPVPGGLGSFSVYVQAVAPSGTGFEVSNALRLDFLP